MSESLILSLWDAYADIPRAIEGKDFPEQLDILRNEFWLKILPYSESNSTGEECMWIKFRWVSDSNKQWVFVENIGLLSFEWDYLVEWVGFIGWGFTPKISIDEDGLHKIEWAQQKWYHGFIRHHWWKCSLWLFDGKNSGLKKFNSHWRDEFESPRILQQVFITAGQLWEISSVQETHH